MSMYGDDDDYECDDDRDDNILRIGPGKARVSFDMRCPVCGDRARDSEMVSPAINDKGESCSYDDLDARWVEWHECPCCGEWYSLISGA